MSSSRNGKNKICSNAILLLIKIAFSASITSSCKKTGSLMTVISTMWMDCGWHVHFVLCIASTRPHIRRIFIVWRPSNNYFVMSTMSILFYNNISIYNK